MPVTVICLTRSRDAAGELVVRLGVSLLDEYLEFLAGRCRPNTVLAVAYDLKVFFPVVARSPRQVRPVDVLAFMTAQRAIESTRIYLHLGDDWLASQYRRAAEAIDAAGIFFVRIDEWGWAEAPPRVPMFPGDLPRLDRPLPKALDDAAAARLLRAAHADRRMLVRVTALDELPDGKPLRHLRAVLVATGGLPPSAWQRASAGDWAAYATEISRRGQQDENQ